MSRCRPTIRTLPLISAGDDSHRSGGGGRASPQRPTERRRVNSLGKNGYRQYVKKFSLNLILLLLLLLLLLPFNGLFFMTTWVSRNQKGKTSLVK